MGADIVVHPHGLQDGPPPRAPSRARAGRRHHRPDAAARRRHRRARPARRVQPPDRGADRRRASRRCRNVGIISRGYENFLDKLDALGADFDVDRLSRCRATRRPENDAVRQPRSGPLAVLVVPFDRACVARIRDPPTPRSCRATAPFVLAPNHYSDIDPLVVAVAVWRLGRAPRFLAKASLFRVPVLGWLLRGTADPGRRASAAAAAKRPAGAGRGARRARPRRHRLPGGHAHARPRPVADARQDRRRAARARRRASR